MKKLLLLLIIPLLSFGQITEITFDDIKKIENKEDFLKLVIEKGFSKTSASYANGAYLSYAKDYDQLTETATIWASYSFLSSTFSFDFVFENKNGRIFDLEYENLIKAIQSECEFINVIENIAHDRKYDIINYNCSDCKFKGPIYYFNTGKRGVIENKGNRLSY